MTQEEEALLIRRVCAGDSAAFEPLVLEHQNRVYAIALRMTGSEADAQDAAQEALLKAYTSLREFRGDSRFSTWLCRLTGNVCIDLLRRRSRQRETSLLTGTDGGEELALEIPDPAPSPEELALRRETREEVCRAMDALPENDREILALRELAGLSYEEIAQKLALSPGTVKSRLNRSRKKLCAVLLGGNISPSGSSNKREGV